MKHLKHLFTALLLLCSTVVAAHDFGVDGIYYNILSEEDKTVEVTFRDPYYNDEYTGSVTIPESVTYNGTTYSVTSIGKQAFWDCSGLTSIVIPNSVISIGERAFSYCSGLTSIIIPNSVTSIGVYAFSWCSGLTSIEIPNSVTSIGEDAFHGCTGLTSITIPNSVTSIEDYAFFGCTGLTSVVIPNSVTSIGDYAFPRCSGLISITIPNSVTSIGDEAFKGCTGLTSITIPNSVTSIGKGAFYSCTGLTSVVIGNSVTSIGSYAFQNCTGLTSVVIGNSVTSIGDHAFYHCARLGAVVNLSNLPLSKGSEDYGYVAYYADGVINSADISDISGISLDRGAVTVEKDESFTLRAELETFFDLELSEASLFTWSTSDSSVATVKDGVVTAVAAGIATITARFGDYSASCMVSVGIFIPITSLEQLKNNALYYISQPHHTNGATSWAVDKGGEALKSNVDLGVELSSSDTRQQFAILGIDGGATRYLYHVGEKKFINKDGSLGEIPVDAVYIKAGAFDNTFMFYFKNTHYINVNGYRQIIINGWSTRDGGNSCAIVSVGEFDPTEVLGQWVTGISLDKSAVTLVEGESLTLKATVLGSVGDMPVAWSTSNSSVVTVKDGVVTAVAAGTATITATAGDYSATCVVTVEKKVIAVTGISLSESKVTLTEGETKTLVATVTPADATDKTVTWSTSNSSVATVKDGVVTAVAPGIAIITAKAGNYSASCMVSVGNFIPITSLEQLKNNALYYISQPYHTKGATSWAVDKGGEALKSNVYLGVELSSSDIRQQFAILGIDGGATRYLYHVGEKKFINKDGSLGENPVDAVNIKAGAFDNTFVFYFDDTHYINVGGLRQITIDGWSIRDGGNSCAIVPVGEFDPTEVLGQWVTGISLDKSAVTLVEGESLTLKATVLGSVGDMPVAWSTSNSSVVTVKDGVVTAVAAGTATITATAGDYSATCVVTVEKKVIAVTGISLSESKVTLTEGETKTLVATVTPADATDKTVAWSTSNSSVATVKDGVVTAVAPGIAIITATAGNYSASCMVSVGNFITSLEQLKNNALYYISQPHHTKGATSWAVDKGGEALKSNVYLGVELSSSDIRQQFAILSIDGGATRYLYHAGEKKFINKDGSLGEKPVDAVYIKAGAFDKTFMFYFDDAHYINVGGLRQMIIDDWSFRDGGNSCTIESVGEFDPEVALGIITGIEDVEDVDGEIVVYNLQGNRILDVDNLDRGIYIVNSKKVFVK